MTQVIITQDDILGLRTEAMVCQYSAKVERRSALFEKACSVAGPGMAGAVGSGSGAALDGGLRVGMDDLTGQSRT